MKLTIELVPLDCFGKNLRSLLSTTDWDAIRKNTYRRHHYACCICGKTNTPLSAHEEWNYKITNPDKNRGVQKLTNILSLCFNCHMIKHICFADELSRQGKLNMNDLINHFYTVNDCSEKEFLAHYQMAIQEWNQRASIAFKINIKWIEKLNIELDSYPLNKKKEGM